MLTHFGPHLLAQQKGSQVLVLSSDHWESFSSPQSFKATADIVQFQLAIPPYETMSYLSPSYMVLPVPGLSTSYVLTMKQALKSLFKITLTMLHHKSYMFSVIFIWHAYLMPQQVESYIPINKQDN